MINVATQLQVKAKAILYENKSIRGWGTAVNSMTLISQEATSSASQR